MEEKILELQKLCQEQMWYQLGEKSKEYYEKFWREPKTPEIIKALIWPNVEMMDEKTVGYIYGGLARRKLIDTNQIEILTKRVKETETVHYLMAILVIYWLNDNNFQKATEIYNLMINNYGDLLKGWKEGKVTVCEAVMQYSKVAGNIEKYVEIGKNFLETKENPEIEVIIDIAKSMFLLPGYYNFTFFTWNYHKFNFPEFNLIYNYMKNTFLIDPKTYKDKISSDREIRNYFTDNEIVYACIKQHEIYLLNYLQSSNKIQKLSQIAEILSLSIEDAEKLLIAMIAKGHFNAKIDLVNQLVYIENVKEIGVRQEDLDWIIPKLKELENNARIAEESIKI